MNIAAEGLLREALALSEADRIELTEALLAIQARARAIPFDPAWMEEARKRSSEIDQGRVATSPWSEVKERVRRRIAESPGG